MNGSDTNIDVIIPPYLQPILNILPFPLALFINERQILWQNKCFADLYQSISKTILEDKLLTIMPGADEKILIKNESYKFSKLKIKNLDNDNLHFVYAFKDACGKDEELKTIAHDLNNIFTGISNSIELLNHKKNDYPELSRTIQVLENNSNRAIELFEEFLTKDKSQKTKKKKINLNLLLDEVSVTMSEIVKGKVDIEMNVPDELSQIMGRYSEVFRILLNLCVNAKDAIKNTKGLILISAENFLSAEGIDSVKIKVKDNGPGIAKENLSKIFDKGFSTKNGKRFSGLGLSIVKQIVEEHEGSINVDSVLGEGTEFTIMFPSIIKQKKTVNNNLPKTICIAEDEEIIREELTELFEYEGYTVIQAKDGKQAVEVLQSDEEVSLLIIDKKMPVQGGLESIEILRNHNINIPIVLATGSVPDYENKKLQMLNIDLVMKKPYSIDELIDNVKKLLG